MNRNCTYYKTVKKHGDYYYILLYIPGDLSVLGTDSKEFPNNLIENECIVRNEYNDNMPIGMPLISEMDLTLDLSKLEGDWTDVRDWILEKEHNLIPNAWKLIKADDEYSAMTSYETIFHGIQETNTEISINTTGEYKVACKGIIESAMKRTLITDINTSSYTSHMPSYTNMIYYNSSAAAYFIVGQSDSGLDYYYMTMNQFGSQVATVLSTVITALTRGEITTVGVSHPLVNWTFYEQDATSTSGQKGALLSDTLITHKVLDKDSNEVGGLLVNTKSSSSWAKEFTNIWSLWERLTEGLIGKGVLQLDSAYRIKTVPILDNIGSTISISTSEAMTEGDIIDNADVLFQQSISHISNVTPEDMNQYTYKNDYVTQSDDSFEIELKLHNQIINMGSEKFKYYRSKAILRWIKFTIMQSVNYINTWDTLDYLTRVHDYCTVDIGGINISSESISSDPDIPEIFDTEGNEYNLWLIDRMKKSGMGYVSAKAGHYLFCNENQFMVELKTDINKINTTNLGELCSIDIDNFIPYNLPANFDTAADNCILTNVEMNVIEGISSCVFFLRGDR